MPEILGEGAIYYQSENSLQLSQLIKKLLNQNKCERISIERSFHSLKCKYYDINKISSYIENAYLSITKWIQVVKKG